MFSKKSPRVSSPLSGVFISITGLSVDEKGELHDIVEKLGGRYNGNLKIGVNTHLIADKAEGAKFYEAYRSGEDVISIVTPAWLRQCEAKNQLVSVQGFKLVPSSSKSTQCEGRASPTGLLSLPV